MREVLRIQKQQSPFKGKGQPVRQAGRLVSSTLHALTLYKEANNGINRAPFDDCSDLHIATKIEEQAKANKS